MGLKKEMKREMERLLDAWHDRYVKHENEEVNLDSDKLIEEAYSNIAGKGKIISEKLYSSLKENFVSELEEELNESYVEQHCYARDPYRYNGLSQKDFY